jgi:hypothetical protein
MKKLLVLSLAIVMMFAMASTCFAADATFDAVGSKTADVTVSYTAGDGADDTYAVDITWGDLAFEYTQSSQIWDATNHVEVDADASASKWNQTSATIEVKNHSNVAVKSTITYAAEGTNGSAVFTLTGGEVQTLAAATPSQQPTHTATLAASGVPAASGKVGTITVTIAAAN